MKKKRENAIPTPKITSVATQTKRGCIGTIIHRLRTLTITGWLILCGGCFLLTTISQQYAAERAPTQTIEASTRIAMQANMTSTAVIIEIQNVIATSTVGAEQTATATLWTKTPIPTITNTPVPTATPHPSNTPLPSATPRPSNTPLPSATPRPSNTPLPQIAITRFPTSSVATFYSITEGARGRSCPRLNCDVAVTLSYAEGLRVIGSATGDNVSGETRWWVAESGSQLVYIHSSLMTRNRPAQQQAAPSGSGSQNTGDGRVPRNCTEARAWGWSAAQAGQYRHLDRDGDGVACYDD